MNRKSFVFVLFGGLTMALVALLAQTSAAPTAHAMNLGALPHTQAAVSNVTASTATTMTRNSALGPRVWPVSLEAQRGTLFRPAGSPPSALTTTSYTWSPLGAGIDDSVDAIAITDSGEVYAGGDFTHAGTCTSADGCNYIAKWDPATDSWSPLGSGMNHPVYTLAISGNTLYAGGAFDIAGDCTIECNYIAKWDTTTHTWSALGYGVGPWGDVHAIAVAGSSVYVGGDFGFARNISGNNQWGATPNSEYFAKWDTSTNTWSGFGSWWSTYGGQVRAIAVKGSDVYVGERWMSPPCPTGNFESALILKWDGSTWSPLGCSTTANGASFSVYALAFSANGDLYIGGGFTQAGNCTSANGCNNIAKWDGLTWSPLGTGTNDMVYAIAVSASGDVYVGGEFTSAGTCTTGCANIAKWDGSTWSDLETGMKGPGDNSVNALAIHGSYLYAGGDFLGAGTCLPGQGCNHIARYAYSSSLYRLYLPLIVR